MSSKNKPDHTLDCIGLYCPEPILRARIELDKLDVGDILEIVADDPAAEEDFKSFVKRVGYELLELQKEGNVIRFLIRKGK